MVAPAVSRLSTAISSSPDELRRAELTAELACYLARTGDLDRAAALTDQLRATYGNGRFARISIWIMLIEALRHFFGNQSAQALDRLRRASLLSGAISDRELVALTEAWMAHLWFNRGNYDNLGVALKKAFLHLSPENIAAKCRLSIILADSFLLLGDQASSRFWYAEARNCASSYGDQAAIGAVTYNRAALQVHALLVARAREQNVVLRPDLVLSEVDSAINYQRIAGLASLDHLLFFARIGALISVERFSEARDLAQRLLSEVEAPLTQSEQTILAFYHALASHGLGDCDAFESLFSSQAYVDSCDALDSADRIILLSYLSRSGVKSIGVSPNHAVHELLDRAVKQYDMEQQALLFAVKDFARPRGN
jgi:hypothetical protein